MRHATLFVLLAVLCAWQAVVVLPGGSAVPLAIGAVTLSLLATTYAYPRCATWLKGGDGRIRLRAWAMLWPYFLLSWLTLLLFRLVNRERAWDEVAPGVYLGRRLFTWERVCMPEIAAVLDLTWEFDEARFLRTDCAYYCIPLPDASPPTLQQLEEGVDWLLRHNKDGNVYVHCALGHGRSATFVAAYLVACGQVDNAQHAISILRSARPGVGLSGSQRTVLEAFVDSKSGSDIVGS